MSRDVVVVGASAGGVQSLREFVAALDADLRAVVLVVLHFPARSPSMLPAILGRVSRLPVQAATEHQPLEPGRVVVAAPDHHLVVLDGHAVLTRGPRENGYRPAVDVLFRSAARACGSRLIGVILSGALDDGTAGMVSVRQLGGVVLAQSPEDAAYPSMPASVIRTVGADRVGTAAELASAVNELTASEGQSAGSGPEPGSLLTREVEVARMNLEAFEDPDAQGRPAGYSCPDCSGTLVDVEDGGMLRFRCRVGHAWSPGSLMAAQSEELEGALWMAFRSLKEKAALSTQLAARAGERGNALTRQRYLVKAEEASRSATVLQQLLEQALSMMPVDDPVEDEHVERV